MALKDEIEFGFVLPCRSWKPIDVESMRKTAIRADELGYRDLWVTENTVDDSFSVDSMVGLAYAAALTSRVRLGVSVVVLPHHSPLHVAHSIASLDYVSSGRAVLGVGLGRPSHYAAFGVPVERRVRRFTEAVEVIKALWTQEKVDYHGEIFEIEAGMALKPVQKPHPPIWLGGSHPDSLRRAARIATGWMGAGGASKASLAEAIPLLREEVEKNGGNPDEFAISKRVFLSVDDNAERAREEALRWFTDVYHNPAMLEANGFAGTPEQARGYIEELRDLGCNHVLLNAVARPDEQVEALAEVVGLK
jgi:probable F420-dependent oxidoreductase